MTIEHIERNHGRLPIAHHHVFADRCRNLVEQFATVDGIGVRLDIANERQLRLHSEFFPAFLHFEIECLLADTELLCHFRALTIVVERIQLGQAVDLDRVGHLARIDQPPEIVCRHRIACGIVKHRVDEIDDLLDLFVTDADHAIVPAGRDELCNHVVAIEMSAGDEPPKIRGNYAQLTLVVAANFFEIETLQFQCGEGRCSILVFTRHLLTHLL